MQNSSSLSSTLKGVLENYKWGYHRKPLDYPFSFSSHIPYSAIAKTILVKSLNFHIYACGKLTFKSTIKRKTKHYFKILTKHFLIRYRKILCLIKIHNWNISQLINYIYKDDMKIIQLFRRFPPYNSNIFEIKPFIKLMPRKEWEL